MNLYELIKKNNFQGFSVALIRRFAFSLLQTLRMLHRERIIHCDLKPENILLRQKGQSSIKVIDFGSSCYEHQRGERPKKRVFLKLVQQGVFKEHTDP